MEACPGSPKRGNGPPPWDSAMTGASLILVVVVMYVLVKAQADTAAIVPAVFFQYRMLLLCLVNGRGDVAAYKGFKRVQAEGGARKAAAIYKAYAVMSNCRRALSHSAPQLSLVW